MLTHIPKIYIYKFFSNYLLDKRNYIVYTSIIQIRRVYGTNRRATVVVSP